MRESTVQETIIRYAVTWLGRAGAGLTKGTLAYGLWMWKKERLHLEIDPDAALESLETLSHQTPLHDAIVDELNTLGTHLYPKPGKLPLLRHPGTEEGWHRLRILSGGAARRYGPSSSAQISNLTKEFLRRHIGLKDGFRLRGELAAELHRFCEQLPDKGKAFRTSEAGKAFAGAQEALVTAQSIFFGGRPAMGRPWIYYRVSIQPVSWSTISISEYLKAKETIILGGEPEPHWYEVDFKPFNQGFARPSDVRFIGRGVEFLNRRLSSRLFSEENKGGQQRVLEFLRLHAYRGRQLMLNDAVKTVGGLRRALRRASKLLDGQSLETPWEGAIPISGSCISLWDQ